MHWREKLNAWNVWLGDVEGKKSLATSRHRLEDNIKQHLEKYDASS
jgi:hypothetical protein